MQLYLDTSALAKLVVREHETDSLRAFLANCEHDDMFVAALARTELIRAVVLSGGLAAVPHARRLLSRMNLVPLSSRLLDQAAMMPPAQLRSLDALHLAAAQSAPALRAVITYDTRLAEAATSLGLAVVTPGWA